METAAGLLVRQVTVKRIDRHGSDRVLDTVAAEEPLEIRLQYWFKGAQRTESLALMMRTPGHDRELATGFLYSEGVIKSGREIREMRSLGGSHSNELLVEVSAEVDVEMWRMSRTAFVSSSCGVCGKRSLDALPEAFSGPATGGFSIGAESINRLPTLLRDWQKGFRQSGGLHAAALAGPDGEIGAVFEDIGRHNALDKLIGSRVLTGHIPLEQSILFLSSRSSFELVQKAVAAGAPVLATVGSPSSLAVETARKYGLTLLGFVRDGRFNIYSGESRIHS